MAVFSAGLLVIAMMQTATTDSGIVHRIGSTPAPGKIVMISVGDEMWTDFDYHARIVAVPQAGVQAVHRLQRITVAPGEELIPGPIGRGFMACSRRKDIDTVTPYETTEPVCLIDDDQDGRFDRTWSMGLFDSGKRFNPGVPYNLIERPIEQAKPARTSLLFLGVSDGSILLDYRIDPDRSGTQLKLPLAPTFPQTINVKGKVFNVTAASAGSLTYSLIR